MGFSTLNLVCLVTKDVITAKGSATQQGGAGLKNQDAHTAPKNILTINAVASRQRNAQTAGQTTMEQHTASAQRQLSTKMKSTGKTLSLKTNTKKESTL